MGDLRTAITAVVVIILIFGLMLLGDYLGYKIGRWKLVSLAGIVTAVIIVAFTIYAAIVLLAG